MNTDFEKRFNNVRIMHDTMVSMNNEDAYEVWIWHMPDCPDESDFEWFAEDEDRFCDLLSLFKRIIKTWGKDGLFRPTDESIDLVSKLGLEIEILN